MPASDARDAGVNGALPPETPDPSRRTVVSSGIGALTLIATAAALYFARDVFVPLAIAGLLAFVLSPPTLWLRHRGLGRALSVIIVVTLAFVATLGFGSVVVGEIASLTKQLPSFAPNIESKLESMRNGLPVDRLLQRGTQLVQELRYELTPPQQSFEPTPNPGGPQAPVPVEIQNQTGFVQILENYVGPVLKPLALAGLVLVFVIFFLLNRENLRDRFIRLAGANDLHRTTQMMNDAVERLSRYLWTELVVNAIYGALMALGTFLIGVPSAALWGGMFLVLRFVPYIGTWIAALFPLALSLTIAPGWSAFFETFSLFIVVELVTSQAIEPWLFGASTGLSPVAVLVAATFWTWLWGPIGLVLSTPLTACLAVIGRYVPALRFFAVLLGDEPALSSEERFYQRLLAGDAAEAAEQAETFLKTGTLADFCDQIAIPALLMGQEDAERGVLTRNTRVEIVETMHDILESIGEEAEETAEGPAAVQAAVECLGARNELDDVAALLLTRLLTESGITARSVPARHWLSEPRIGRAGVETSTRVICLSHLGPASAPRLRLLARRLRRRSPPHARIMLGLWSGSARDVGESVERPAAIADLETSLGAAVDRITEYLGAAPAPAATPEAPQLAAAAPNAG